MFNREIQVKMAKTNKKADPESSQEDFVPATLMYVSKSVNNLFKELGKGLVVYIVLDTFRQIMVEKAKRL
jgi:hypothetical protein